MPKSARNNVRILDAIPDSPWRLVRHSPDISESWDDGGSAPDFDELSRAAKPGSARLRADRGRPDCADLVRIGQTDLDVVQPSAAQGFASRLERQLRAVAVQAEVK